MDYFWGEWDLDDNGEPIYNESRDLHRQLGFATIALYRKIYQLSTSQELSFLRNELIVVADQMRLFVVGNTTQSYSDFIRSYNYCISNLTSVQNQLIRESRTLVGLCSTIIEGIKSGSNDYVNELFETLSLLGVYSIEEPSELVEA